MSPTEHPGRQQQQRFNLQTIESGGVEAAVFSRNRAIGAGVTKERGPATAKGNSKICLK